jgi:hypothetical protein
MDGTDRFFTATPRRAKRPRRDLETAMAELLELRAKVKAAARFSGMPSYRRKVDLLPTNGTQCSDKPHNRTR